jgi:hypothetical protein
MSMRRFNIPLIILFLALPYAAFVLLAFPRTALDRGWGLIPSIIVLTLAFIAIGLHVYFQVQFLLARYAGDLHDLDSDDARYLILRLLFGLCEYPPKSPVLVVQVGRTAPDGPEVIHKVGGPAHLSIAPGNIVVTSRLGILHRVLIPGFHDLDPFERVWDVLDLRPQRRSITVEFMTRDGIPASTDVNVVCRPALPQLLRKPAGAAELSASAMERITQVVLGLTTSKYVRRSSGDERVSDWVAGIVNGATDGVVRDVLEQYSLDSFINPQRWLVDAELPSRVGVTPLRLPDLERRILQEVRRIGRSRGIVVEKVELGPVHPAPEAIARQWLEFWIARLQRNVDEYVMNVEADQTQQLLDVQLALQVDFLKRTLDSVEKLSAEHASAPMELIYDSIMQVVLSIYQGNPEMRYMLFQQGESLVRFVQMILYGPSALPPSQLGDSSSSLGSSPDKPLPSPDTSLPLPADDSPVKEIPLDLHTRS